jgi:hypothetical protein
VPLRGHSVQEGRGGPVRVRRTGEPPRHGQPHRPARTAARFPGPWAAAPALAASASTHVGFRAPTASRPAAPAARSVLHGLLGPSCWPQVTVANVKELSKLGGIGKGSIDKVGPTALQRRARPHAPAPAAAHHTC